MEAPTSGRDGAPHVRTVGRRDLARSFGSAAAAYAELRPGYPQDALDSAIPVDAREVLDLGAGTGKLTAGLLRPGRVVRAVEPDPDMLAELMSRFPRVPAELGSAEQIPLPDGSVDVVAVGQALHWFDLEIALAEMARVLRPGGRLVMIWNTDDRSDALTHALSEVTVRAFEDVLAEVRTERPEEPPPFTGRRDFADPVLATTPWARTMSREELHALEDTKSYLLTAAPDMAARVHAELDEVLDRHRVTGAVTVRHVCRVWSAVRR